MISGVPLVAGAAVAAVAVSILVAPQSPDNAAFSDMVAIPGGSAILGGENEHSMVGPRSYYVAPFEIDRFEVTNAEFRSFVTATGATPAAFAGEEEFDQDDQAVTGVTWDQAHAYCKWAGKRLPSEVEWEKAARGSDGQSFPWGDIFDGDNAKLDGKLPVTVASFPQDISPFGVRGMAGNVSEWIADTSTAQGGVCGRVQNDPSLAYLAKLYGTDNLNICSIPDLPPELAPVEVCAYIKGNSWSGRPHMTVSSNRMWDYATSYAEFVGFRCAVSSQESI